MHNSWCSNNEAGPNGMCDS